MQTASRHDQQGAAAAAGPMAYPAMSPAPPSPTLTNPDMILPDYDESALLTPGRSQSPLALWDSANPADMQFNLSPDAFSGTVASTTPFIYGNGTMLSDIGEVTEAESVCGAPGNRTSMLSSKRSTLTMPYDMTKRRENRAARPRRMSTDSNSTVTTNEPNQHHGQYADFDDSVSVGDSNFQGDDEESVADSYAGEESARQAKIASQMQAHPQNDMSDSSVLSRRAEEILANAKRRLTTMEGNLTRARTSFHSPMSSIGSLGSGSTPSPPPHMRTTTAIHRDLDREHASNAQKHSRIYSENNVPTGFRQNHTSQRSSSALGAAGGYRKPYRKGRELDHVSESQSGDADANGIYGNSSFAKSKTSLGAGHGLEPLSEDELTEGADSGRPSLDSAQLGSFLSPTFGDYADKGLKRSASTTQMKDLKHQMNDLKGRLSTLRDQARADSLKRRSLSSLRTPSPFTHSRVEQWYAGTPEEYEHDDGSIKEVDDTKSSDAASSVYDGSFGNGTEDQATEQAPFKENRASYASGFTIAHSDDEEPQPETLDDGQRTPVLSPSGSPGQQIDDDMRTEDGYDDEDDADNFEDAYSESGESLYHDSVQNQMSHEDREDAFDYEHFFLHSAMGSMSQQTSRRRDSQGSYSSDGSVATTRGPIAPSATETSVKNKRRSRRASVGSVSTVDSFLTATEGRSTRADTHVFSDHEEEIGSMPSMQSNTPPDTAKRSTFGNRISGLSDSGSGSDPSPTPGAAIPRSRSSAAAFALHRPSVSSFSSTGTNRSFPLVNRPKVNGGVLTPRDSPDQELQQISEELMSETASICDAASVYSRDGEGGSQPMHTLVDDDQTLVKKVVASLGKCVLGLTEAGQGTPESAIYRRRIEMARRILNGAEDNI